MNTRVLVSVLMAGAVALAVLGFGSSGEPRMLAGAAADTSTTLPAVERASGEVSRREISGVRLVDSNTSRAVVGCLVLIESPTGTTRARTGHDGFVAVDPGVVQLRPAAAHVFEPVTIEVTSEVGEVAVACRCRVKLAGVESSIVSLRELPTSRTAGDSRRRGPGGLLLGSTLREWRKPGEYLIPTTLTPLVLEVARGTIHPAHPVWAGKTSIGEDGRRRILPPRFATPARVSRVLRCTVGSDHEFHVLADRPPARVEYMLTAKPSGPGTVELFAIKPFGEGDRVVGMTHRKSTERGTSAVVFDRVEPGDYVVRSAMRVGDRVCLAWQVVEIEQGCRNRIAEQTGRGGRTLWFTGDTRRRMVVDTECGEQQGIPVSYGAFHLRGVTCLEGLWSSRGSVDVHDFDRRSTKRLQFDLDTRSGVTLKR